MQHFVRAAAGAIAMMALTATAAPRPSLEEAVLARINHARENPQEYARELREYRRWFDGRLLLLPGDASGRITHEGAEVVDDAIDFLERQAPLLPLSLGEVLTLAARDHADEQGPAGATGHVSRDGASPGDRVRRRGGDIYVGETISYGYDAADEVVRQLIVDDGVPGRGHRKLLFDAGFRFAGVGCGEHRRFRHMCVVALSGTASGTSGTPATTAMRPGDRLFRYRAR